MPIAMIQNDPKYSIRRIVGVGSNALAAYYEAADHYDMPQEPRDFFNRSHFGSDCFNFVEISNAAYAWLSEHDYDEEKIPAWIISEVF